MSKQLFFALIGLVLVASAQAQTPSPMMDWQYSTGEVLTTTPEVLEKFDGGRLPDWRSDVGPGFSVMPTFQGSKRYHLLPSAILDFRYKDEFFVSDGEGIG